jgi:hypothetical protein
MRRTAGRRDPGGMTSPISRTTTAFYAQAGLSFAAALIAVGFGISYLPVDPWIRAFLAVGTLFLVTSTFTLAKCVRDAQETSDSERFDLARLH